MLSETWSLIVNQSDFFTDLMIQHLEISLISVVFAIIIGLGLGIFISEYPKNKWVLAIVNLIYTIPSIALFGFLIPVSGVGNTSAVIALTIYGLLPMVRILTREFELLMTGLLKLQREWAVLICKFY